MDQPGEWYFDPSDPNQYLYFYYRPFPDETEPKEETSWFALDEDPYLNASSYMNAGIEFVGKVDNEGKSVGKISAIRIEGLRVFTSAGAGIRLKSVPTVAINNVYVSSTTDQ